MNEDHEDCALFKSFGEVEPSEESSKLAVEKARRGLTREQVALPSVNSRPRQSRRSIEFVAMAAALLVAVTVVFLQVTKNMPSKVEQPQKEMALIDGDNSHSMTLPNESLSTAAKAIPFLHPTVADFATVMVANGGNTPLELGSRVTTADSNGKLHVWDWSQGKTSRILPGIEYWGIDSAITPDGRKLLFQYKQIIDLATGQTTPIDLGEATVEIGGATYGRLGGTHFSPDGSRLAIMVTEMDLTTPGRIEREFMRVVEFPSAKVLSEMPLGESYKLRVDFSADGKRIAMGDTEQQVTLRETDSGKVMQTFAPKLASQLISIAVSPDGKFVAASDREPGDLYIWETSQGKLLHTIKAEELAKRGATGHAHGALRFSPDGQFLGDGRWSATLIVDVSKGSIEAALKDDFPSQIQWSADGSKLTIIGSVVLHDPQDQRGMDNSYPSVRIWDWRTGSVDNLSQ